MSCRISAHQFKEFNHHLCDSLVNLFLLIFFKTHLCWCIIFAVKLLQVIWTNTIMWMKSNVLTPLWFICFCRLAVTMDYYGLSLSSSNLNGDIYWPSFLCTSVILGSVDFFLLVDFGERQRGLANNAMTNNFISRTKLRQSNPRSCCFSWIGYPKSLTNEARFRCVQ